MAEATCVHNFCETDHCEPDCVDVHESPRVRIATADGGHVLTQVSYRDGDRMPVLYLSAADRELTPGGLDELIAVLQEQRLIMRAVQPTPVRV